MFIVVEKTGEYSKVIDIVDEYESLIKNLSTKFSDEYQELENITRVNILSNNKLEPKNYLVNYGTKYVLYKKSLVITKGYIYNSSSYDVIKLCQWNILLICNKLLRSRLDKIFINTRDKDFYLTSKNNISQQNNILFNSDGKLLEISNNIDVRGTERKQIKSVSQDNYLNRITKEYAALRMNKYNK